MTIIISNGKLYADGGVVESATMPFQSRNYGGVRMAKITEGIKGYCKTCVNWEIHPYIKQPYCIICDRYLNLETDHCCWYERK